MPQSLSSILIHLVFSTKNREPLIRRSVRSDLHAYGTTVLKNAGCPTLAFGGTADHVHALFDLSRVASVADVVKELKVSTSKWIKTAGPQLDGFHWQAGYGAFSVSQSNVARVIRYIQEQEEHHRHRSFQDEFRALLRRHRIASPLMSGTCGIDCCAWLARGIGNGLSAVPVIRGNAANTQVAPLGLVGRSKESFGAAPRSQGFHPWLPQVGPLAQKVLALDAPARKRCGQRAMRGSGVVNAMRGSQRHAR